MEKFLFLVLMLISRLFHAYFMPVPTRLFLCLCLCLSHKWEPGFTAYGFQTVWKLYLGLECIKVQLHLYSSQTKGIPKLKIYWVVSENFSTPTTEGISHRTHHPSGFSISNSSNVVLIHLCS